MEFARALDLWVRTQLDRENVDMGVTALLCRETGTSWDMHREGNQGVKHQIT